MLVIFQNLSPKTICGFQHMDNTLHVFLSSSSTNQSLLLTEIKCVDAEEAKEILAFGIGACIRLYNVKGSSSSTMTMTVNSGVRLVQHQQRQQRKPDNQNPVIETTTTKPPPTENGHAWCATALITLPKVFASHAICLVKKVPADLCGCSKDCMVPTYRYETWNCDSCFARKNSPLQRPLLEVWRVQKGEEEAKAHVDAECKAI
jgi:hypothetical protein